MATKKKNTKDHRQRKNPHAAETFQQRRHERNAERPKQIWNGKEWSR